MAQEQEEYRKLEEERLQLLKKLDNIEKKKMDLEKCVVKPAKENNTTTNVTTTMHNAEIFSGVSSPRVPTSIPEPKILLLNATKIPLEHNSVAEDPRTIPTSKERSVAVLPVPRWRINRHTTEIWKSYTLVREAGSSGEVYDEADSDAIELDSNDESPADEFTQNLECETEGTASPAPTIASPTYRVPPSPPSVAGKNILDMKPKKDATSVNALNFSPVTNGTADSIPQILSSGQSSNNPGLRKIMGPGGEFKPADSRAIPVLIGGQALPNRNQQAPDVVRCLPETDNQPELNDSFTKAFRICATVASTAADRCDSTETPVHSASGHQPPPAQLAKPRSGPAKFNGQLRTTMVEVQVEQHMERIEVWQLDAIVSDAHQFYVPEHDPRWAFRTNTLHKLSLDSKPAIELDKIDSKGGKDRDGMDFKGNYPIFRSGGKAYGIRYDGSTRVIVLNGKPWTVPMNMARVIFGGTSLLAFGGPGHEVIINDEYFHVPFGGEEKNIVLKSGRRLTIRLPLPGDRPRIVVMPMENINYMECPIDISGVSGNDRQLVAGETEVERSKSKCREDDTSREYRSKNSRGRDDERRRSQGRSIPGTVKNSPFSERPRRDDFHHHRTQIDGQIYQTGDSGQGRRDLRHRLIHLRDRRPHDPDNTRSRHDRSFDHSPPPSKIRKMLHARDDDDRAKHEWLKFKWTRSEEFAHQNVTVRRSRSTTVGRMRSPTRSGCKNRFYPDIEGPDDISREASGSPKPRGLMKPLNVVHERRPTYFSMKHSLSRARSRAPSVRP